MYYSPERNEVMKRTRAFILLLLAMGMLASSNAFALITRHPELDLAFSLLEKDNIFLRRYNEITGAGIQARFDLGLPYLFGGQNAKEIFRKQPTYTVREAWEDSKFYKKDARYLHGFDCRGFALWINRETGKKALDSLSNILSKYWQFKDNYLFSHRDREALPPFHELKMHLQIGDYLVARNGSRHIMMYIGTLSDYGFSEKELPDMKDYLDYPLVIHSAPNPQYPERIQAFLEGNEKYKKCLTTDGGICVSIIGMPAECAPRQIKVQINQFYYFPIDQGRYMLTVWDFSRASSFVWFRSSYKNPSKAVESKATPSSPSPSPLQDEPACSQESGCAN